MNEKIHSALEKVRKIFSSSQAWFMGGLLGVLIIAISILFFYLAPRENALVQGITKELPYPIALVSGKLITERSLYSNMESVKRFYQNQDFSGMGLRVDLTTDEGKKRLRVKEREVFNKMVEDKAIEVIAKDKGIEVTDEEVKQDIKDRIDNYGTGNEVVANLERLYGWSLKDFANKVVKPSLYQQKLIAVYEGEVDQSSSRQKIEAAEKELSSGKPFEEIAKQYSEGNTSGQGGELGWFQLLDLAPELQPVVESALVNVSTPIQETSLGYHIVLVHEIKKEEPTTLYRISQVFVRKTTFSEWLTKEIQKREVYVWSPFYRWNNELAEVDFVGEDWQQYEQAVYVNQADDALFAN